MSAFLEFIVAWIIDYFAAATLVLAAALALRLLIRQPAARMSVTWCAYLGLVALALLTALPSWPRIALADLPASWFAANADSPLHQPETNLPPVEFPVEVTALIEPIDAAPIEFSSHEPMIAAAIGQSDVAAPDLPWSQLAAVVWLGTGVLAICWIVLGHWRTRGLLKAAVKAPAWAWEELKHIVECTNRSATKGAACSSSAIPGLWASRQINSAVALGAWAPKIVLPDDSVNESNAPAVRAALAHEWAHIRHGDLWLLAIERLLLPFLAVHPLFWWLRRSMRLDQELLADAAAAGDEPAEYAQALLIWARTAQPARHGLAALSMWEHPSTLSRRVAMILDPKRRVTRPLSRAWTAITVALAMPAILALSLFSLRPTTAQEEPAAAPAESPLPLSRVEAGERTFDLAPAGKSVPVTQVQLDLLLMSVSREKLAAADTTLEDAIAEATESRCRREAGLVVADVSADDLVKLLDTLKKHAAVKVLSRPSVLTLDGRDAVVHVGGEVPILRVEETINGQHEQRVEYKDYGPMIAIRPKVQADARSETIALELVAEQATLLPPGETAEAGAVPRDAPGLVSHKFKLAADAKIGGSLLVAESPADKKHLQAAKDQFVVVVSPKKIIRTTSVAYADPREGEKGEAARAATEVALNAATAAEPEPDTAAAALLKAERDARAKETAELRQQIEALQRDLAKLRAATETKVITREYALKHRKAGDVAADLSVLVGKGANQERLQLTVDTGHNSVVIQVGEKYADEFAKVIAALDRPPAPLDPNDPDDAYVQQLQKTLAERRKQRVDLGTEKPLPPPSALKPATDPPAQAHAHPANWGLIMADIAEARLELERAEKEFARVEQLKGKNVISEEQVEQKKYELERAKIQLQRAESKLYAPWPAAQSPATTDRGGLSKAAEVRLLELDLADAKLAVELAETELQRVEQLRKQNPGSISEQEIRKYQFQADRAKIQVQRMMIKLEAAKEPQGAAR